MSMEGIVAVALGLSAVATAAGVAAWRSMLAARARADVLLDSVTEGICGVDLHGHITFANRAASEMVGVDPEALVGQPYDAYFRSGAVDDTTGVVGSPILATLRKGTVQRVENDLLTGSDGNTRPIEYTATPVHKRDAIAGAVVTFRDITERMQVDAERRSLETRLRQSQKMEAIGQLAGGVAHDFNNLLSIINNYAAFLLDELPPGDTRRADVKEIAEAGQRAGALVKQLLAFSRRDTTNPVVLDLNEVVDSSKKLLGRTIGEDIRLSVRCEPELAKAKVDPGHVEQVLMNLAVNARDAMPGGGLLLIETANVHLDADFGTHELGLEPGPYVRLSVTDTGEGMSQEVVNHIFEPFFTTKERGSGTGLGLATVYGIVNQCGGGIHVYSEEGFGTTFKVYFPITDETAIAEEELFDGLAGRGETILVAEDEEGVREITRRILTRHGFNVMTAASGREALMKLIDNSGKVDLVLTDVVMPEMSGRELAMRVGELDKKTKVLYMSGYPAETMTDRGLIDAGALDHLQKPFNAAELVRKVRELLPV